jgi:hypothetical protein
MVSGRPKEVWWQHLPKSFTFSLRNSSMKRFEERQPCSLCRAFALREAMGRSYQDQQQNC